MADGPAAPSSVWSELKRRNVIKVGVAYLIGAVAVGEASDVFLPPLGAPAWVVPVVLALLLIGLPLALALAWAYDVTPEGVRRDRGTQTTSSAAEVVADDPEAGSTPPPSSASEPYQRAEDAGRSLRSESAVVTGSFPPSDRRSVAVLPLLNLSGDPDNEYFSDGVTDEILRHLAQVRGLKVISRTSVMRYKGTEKSIREIAEDLRVGTILEGSVQRASGRVRVVAQLIDASTDEHLWADTYDRDLADVFSVQSDIAQKIAGALEAELSDSVRRRIEQRPTESLEAFELALRGRQEWERQDLAALERAVGYFRQALEVDPTYASALADIAMCYGNLPYFADRPSAAYIEPMRAAALRAVELDPELAEAYACLAVVQATYDWDWPVGRETSRRALEVNPNSAYVHLRASLIATFSERRDAAVFHARRAFALDPHSPTLAAGVSQGLMFSGLVEEALDLMRPVAIEHPDHPLAQVTTGLALSFVAEFEEADRFLRRAEELWDGKGSVPAVRLTVMKEWGRASEAEEMAEALRRRSREGWIEPYAMFLAEVAMEDLDEAFCWLDRAVVQKSPYLNYLRCAERYRPLRGDPRFMAVLNEVWPDDGIEALAVRR